MAKNFIITKEHRRFTEFANAVRKERTIGICHGDAGIGKTQSARRYAHWDTVEPFITEWGPRTEDDAKFYATANRCRTVFYLSLIHISEPTRRLRGSRMPSSA